MIGERIGYHILRRRRHSSGRQNTLAYPVKELSEADELTGEPDPSPELEAGYS